LFSFELLEEAVATDSTRETVRVVKRITTMEDRQQLVTQLTRASYTRWKYEMVALLESKSVEGLIDGTKTEPAETADEITKATWRKNNAMAKSLISDTR